MRLDKIGNTAQGLIMKLYPVAWTKRRANVVSLVAAVLLLSGAGYYVHTRSHAAVSTASYEAEDGTLAHGSSVVSRPNASGGQAIKFGAPTDSGTPAANDKFGMSAPKEKWDERLADVGGPTHIKYRRVYHRLGFGDSLTLEKQAQAAGMIPVIDWKTGSYSWADVASGKADADLRAVVTKLNAIPGPKIVSIWHEPAKDGTPADWSAMQLHALPILATANNVQVGVIGNGWWWTSKANGLSDAEIAKWLPKSLINICDFIGADTYEDEGLAEDGSVKIKNMVSWAGRVGGVKGIGIGEFNGLKTDGSSVTAVMNVVKKEPLVKWALDWNSADSGVGLYLSGARLDAFKAGLATPNQT